jgi:hypothetical protein
MRHGNDKMHYYYGVLCPVSVSKKLMPGTGIIGKVSYYMHSTCTRTGIIPVVEMPLT